MTDAKVERPDWGARLTSVIVIVAWLAIAAVFSMEGVAFFTKPMKCVQFDLQQKQDTRWLNGLPRHTAEAYVVCKAYAYPEGTRPNE